jgi:hypothetical protein
VGKRTEITIDTQRFVVIRKHRGSMRTWCELCRAEVDMIRPDEAAALSNLSSRIIYRWIEESRLHFQESAGVLRICANSFSTNRQDTPSHQRRTR